MSTSELSPAPPDTPIVRITYTNWRGVTSERRIIPREIRHGKCEWHPQPCYLLEAYDVDKQADRTFAMTDIHSWEEFIPR